jgi:hypothetical protein
LENADKLLSNLKNAFVSLNSNRVNELLEKYIEEIIPPKESARAKVMVRVRPVTKDYGDNIKADSYGKDAYEAVEEAKKLMRE